jgi:SAM-dependent methyltransferase
MTRVAHPPADARTVEGWSAVAREWTAAVRAGLDPVRAIACEALVKLVRQVPTGPILDAGCGEGWLARELAARGHRVMAFDGAAGMVAQARDCPAPEGLEFKVLTFAEASSGPRKMGSAYGTIVFNFSLLEERITPVLSAAGSLLYPYGRLLVQAAHPFCDAGEYRDGWRMLREVAPGVTLSRPVPWYFRTFSTWVLELRRAGLLLVETYEPLDPRTGRPVSLILSATIPERRRAHAHADR